MDFFEQQQNARRQSRLMVIMFLFAVMAIVVLLNLAGLLIWVTTSGAPIQMGVEQTLANATPSFSIAAIVRQAPGALYLAITTATLGIIAFGSISTLLRLSSGGSAVAEMVGARPVSRDSRDPQERRLLNIVEEMAIASGITVPPVYIMDDESGINAFAAGFSPNEAVVTVTRGTLETLSRDELQGVVGHEFSHILNGDMRLNIHLMGVIAGIVMIGALGRFLMNANRDSSNRSRDNDSRVFLVGLLLWLVGSVGVLAGRLIKAAISRQREFLADASAVQFTRNPEGIGGALFKIGQQGTPIGERHAEDLSHMYFAASLSSLFGMLDTHPPVNKRIERLMGPGAHHLLRDRIRRQPRSETQAESAALNPLPEGLGSALSDAQTGAALSAAAWGRAAAPIRTTAQHLLDSVGNPTPEHYLAAQSVLQHIPAAMREATRTAEGAQAVLFALLLGDAEIRGTQLAAVQHTHGENIARQAAAFVTPLREIGPRARMPLMELALPTLKALPQTARDALLAKVGELIEADRKITLGEFVLLTLCRRHLGSEIKGAPPVKHKDINSVATEASMVLAVLAHAGKAGVAGFDTGMNALGLRGALRPPAELGIGVVEKALYELKLLAPLKKPAFIKACLAVVMVDGKLSVLEGELMRALCAALDSPLPPLIDTIEPAS